jgi:hypothetical protein
LEDILAVLEALTYTIWDVGLVAPVDVPRKGAEVAAADQAAAIN